MTDQDGKPHHLTWRYTRAELVADGIVHGVGIGLTICGAIILLALCALAGRADQLVTAGIYALSLLAALTISAAYNLWPVSPTKWWLRRFDHAAIFLLIAGTYTPLLAEIPDPRVSRWLLGGIWAAAALGIATKIVLPGRFDRLTVALYLILGWSGLLAIGPVVAALPPAALVLIFTGGLLYSTGVVFHLWHELRFQNAIWHGFVLIASACYYGAVVNALAATAH
jgi:hemolysin III